MSNLTTSKLMASTTAAIIVFFFLSLSSTSSSTQENSNDFDFGVWPKPRSIQSLPASSFSPIQPNSKRPISPSFRIHSPHHLHLRPAVIRYLRLILREKWHPLRTLQTPNSSFPSSPLETLEISVSDLSSDLQHGVDESYRLTIPSSSKDLSVNLTASTTWGAMRGLETFSQMIAGNSPEIPAGIRIFDYPMFPHRGVLLDTSRNFYPAKDILRTIKAMSYNKLNVFHWHITDSHSFPLVLPSEPDLAGKGSYGREMVYSPADVKRVIDYGFRHGVRVIPEIDTPGHTGSWSGAYPDIVTCSNKFWWQPGSSWEDRFASEPGTGQLNPLNPKTYEVVRNVINDVTSMFPELFYHAGSDEIAPGCWKSDSGIRSFLSNGGSLSQLLEKFINSTHKYIVEKGQKKAVVYWEDVLLDSSVKVDKSYLLRETTILQTWRNGSNNTKLLTSMGYRVIVSSSDYYYLDCGHGGWLGNDSSYDRPPTDGDNGGSWCNPFKTWQRVYNYDITDGLSEDERELVLGGEVAVWSEQADGMVLDGIMWPRASAMAEALWSGNRGEDGRKRYAEAVDRLNEWRWRMVGRGIRATPIQPLWCLKNPGMCNSNQ